MVEVDKMRPKQLVQVFLLRTALTISQSTAEFCRRGRKSTVMNIIASN